MLLFFTLLLSCGPTSSNKERARTGEQVASAVNDEENKKDDINKEPTREEVIDKFIASLQDNRDDIISNGIMSADDFNKNRDIAKKALLEFKEDKKNNKFTIINNEKIEEELPIFLLLAFNLDYDFFKLASESLDLNNEEDLIDILTFIIDKNVAFMGKKKMFDFIRILNDIFKSTALDSAMEDIEGDVDNIEQLKLIFIDITRMAMVSNEHHKIIFELLSTLSEDNILKLFNVNLEYYIGNNEIINIDIQDNIDKIVLWIIDNKSIDDFDAFMAYSVFFNRVNLMKNIVNKYNSDKEKNIETMILENISDNILLYHNGVAVQLRDESFLSITIRLGHKEMYNYLVSLIGEKTMIKYKDFIAKLKETEGEFSLFPPQQ